MKEITLLDFLKSGAHFGHTTSRWNPKMKPYIFTVRSGIHILDLEQTKKNLEKAMKFAGDVAGKGGTVLFVGTKRQSKDIIKKAATACGMPYINVRWLGGTFTNFKTIQRTVRKMERLEGLKASGELETKYTKKERLMIDREIEKMEKLFEGIKNMKKLPDAIFVTDVKHDDIAVKEAQKSNIKIVGVVDTNVSPVGINYVIPANDDATKAIELICQAMSDAILESRAMVSVKEAAPEVKESASVETSADKEIK
jgi:small subunit ribosomal protein S2